MMRKPYYAAKSGFARLVYMLPFFNITDGSTLYYVKNHAIGELEEYLETVDLLTGVLGDYKPTSFDYNVRLSLRLTKLRLKRAENRG